MTSTNAPTLDVKINQGWYKCFRNSLFDFFNQNTGLVAEVLLDARKNITGLVRIGTIEFEADGKTPKALDVNRPAGKPAGSRSLF
jgi:hypothetical protein